MRTMIPGFALGSPRHESWERHNSDPDELALTHVVVGKDRRQMGSRCHCSTSPRKAGARLVPVADPCY